MKLSRTFATTAAGMLAASQTASATGWESVLGALAGAASQPAAIDMAACERPSEIAFFANAGCPGFLDAIIGNDVAAIARARVAFTAYADQLIAPLLSETAMFIVGPEISFAVPPRLPHKLKMLRLRTPELLALQLRDTVSVAGRVLGPLASGPSGDIVGDFRAEMRALGVDPQPAQVLGMLGQHDARLLALWGQSDPDGLRDFLLRLEAIIDVL